MPAKKKAAEKNVSETDVIIEDLNELPKRKSYKKKVEEPQTLEAKLNSQFQKQLKVTAILLLLISVLVLIALVSYTPKDEAVGTVTFSELTGLLKGNEAAKAKVEFIRNWLGVFGALCSNFLINSTFGYAIIGLPFIIALWAKNLYMKFTIPEKTIKTTIYYFVYAFLFASFMGTLAKTSFAADLPKEWCGAVGTFTGYFTSGIMGGIGSGLVILAAGVIFTLYITNFKAEETAAMIKVKLAEIKDRRLNESSMADKSDETLPADDSDDTDEPARIIKRNTARQDLFKKFDDEEEFDREVFANEPLPNVAEVPTVQADAHAKNVEATPEEDDIVIHRSDRYKPVIERIIVEETPDNAESSESIAEVSSDTCVEKEEDASALTKDAEMFENKEVTMPGSKTPDEATEAIENYEELRKPLKVTVERLAENDTLPKSLINTDLLDENIKYVPPGPELLNSDETEAEVNHDEIKLNARILREKLETFKINIDNMSATTGPVVTQYEFVPAPGIKISKIESLADDMAMALKARGIRIIAPIPGKGTIGIEIPNQNPATVRFGNVANSAKFKQSGFKLPIAFGKTISGEVYCADLAKMPHLLIAGATGSGKSVGINTIIMSLIYSMSPKNLKFVIVDPKKVELRQYAALENHFLAVSPDIDDSIITDPQDAVVALKAACAEMDLRYDILAKAGQRNISDYNQKVAEGKFKDSKDILHRQMPYIVVVIDELADLMLTAAKEVETPIIRLAQLARAVGIHLVLATQRPSVDVITGIIKANFPARAAYLVASKVDSRTILDVMGADQLLGNGDMLFLAGGSPKPIRIQNAFISTDEVEAVCDFIGNQEGYSKPYMLPSLIEKKDSGSSDYGRDDRDPLFEEAANLIIQHQQGSVSLVQRRLKVGYARAARIIDELERAGVVGPFDGSKARAVYMESPSELQAIL